MFLGNESDQSAQWLIYGFGIGKIFLHIWFENYWARFTRYRRAVRFVNYRPMPVSQSLRVFAAHAFAEIIFFTHFFAFFIHTSYVRLSSLYGR